MASDSHQRQIVQMAEKENPFLKEFSEEFDSNFVHTLKRVKRDQFSGRDYKKLLEKAEKRTEKLQQIVEKNPEKGHNIEKNIRFDRAIKRAMGLKVKDNVELLKKGLKNKMKMKTKSKQKWTERKEKIKEQQGRKQDKRVANIQKRRDDKMKKRQQKSIKKSVKKNK